MSDVNGVGGAFNRGGIGRTGGQGTQPADKATLHSWYEAMAGAWGEALDGQAAKITHLAERITVAGEDNPSAMTMLSAESMRMQFMSTSAHTATSSVGQALETLARKQ